MKNKKTGEQTYFFESGIDFACQQCGACCMGDPGTVYVSPEEIKRIAGQLNQSREEFLDQNCYPLRDSYSLKEDDEGTCVFYDEGCRIYNVRPSQCRTFPFWVKNFRNRSRWLIVSEACPGIGTGRHYVEEEILKRLKDSDI